MKIYRPEFFNNKLFISICIITVILTSGHAYQTMGYNFSYLTVVMAVFFLYPIGYIYTRNKLNIYLLAPITFLIMVSLTLIYYRGQNLYSSIFFVCGFLFAFGLVLMYDFQCFMSVFIKIMDMVSVSGLIGYQLVNHTSILEKLPLSVNINQSYYRTSFIFSYMIKIPERNCGMFWEPGLFATFLIFAILCELVFKNKKPSYLRLLLYSWCIFTTNSSAGFLLWTICFFVFLLNRRSNKSKSKRINMTHLILFSVFLLFVINLDLIIVNSPLRKNEYVTKLLIQNLKESSRYKAIIHNLQVFCRNPLVGAGKTEVTTKMKYVADTSTSTYIISLFGVLGMAYTVYLLYGIWKFKTKNIYIKLCVTVIILSIVNKEPHMDIIFTWCMLFYLLKNSIYLEREKKM